MGAVLLSPLYILLNIYLVLRLLAWFSTLHSFLGRPWFVALFLTAHVLIALTPLTGAFCRGKLKFLTKQISNYWLGTLMYLLIFLLFSDLMRIIYCLALHRSVFTPFGTFAYRIIGGVILLASAMLSLYGIHHAEQLRLTRYEAAIRKECPLPSLKIALAADLHLGHSVQAAQLQKICDAVNAVRPDLVIFAGDIFDNEFDAIRQPGRDAEILKSIKSTYGSFACWGNHDVEEIILAGFTFGSGSHSAAGSPKMKQFLSDSGIRLLEDETLLIDGSFYLSGRLDASCKEKSGTDRLAPTELTAGLDRSKPLIVIDHQPGQLRELSEAGADLVLSGHTHDGQIFPGNITTRIGWLNSCGKLTIGNMTSIVTSGAGIWGPPMRIGTNSEVVEITVNFGTEE